MTPSTTLADYTGPHAVRHTVQNAPLTLPFLSSRLNSGFVAVPAFGMREILGKTNKATGRPSTQHQGPPPKSDTVVLCVINWCIITTHQQQRQTLLRGFPLTEFNRQRPTVTVWGGDIALKKKKNWNTIRHHRKGYNVGLVSEGTTPLCWDKTWHAECKNFVNMLPGSDGTWLRSIEEIWLT